jgi:pyridoxal phosphate enzyme (YggS family)
VIAAALAAARERLDNAGGRAVRIVAVTKGFPAPVVVEALEAGVRDVGESYAQELAGKLPEVARLRSLADVDVHFIGRLQTNKVRLVAPWVTRWDSLDRRSVVDEVARRSPGARVLVQVNTVGDTAKGGADPADVPDLIEHATARGLVVEGLMTVGPTHGGVQAARPGFALVRSLVDRWGLAVCSMGMSDDLEVAVAEGTTEVRLGSALFGSRPRRSHDGAVA